MTATATPIIAVRDLTKTYELGELQVKALRGVTLNHRFEPANRDRCHRFVTAESDAGHT